jgi:hypothetical protein
MGVSRREFLRSAAGAMAVGALAAGARGEVSEAPGIPKRKLGRTGFEASILAIGIGAMGDGRLPEDQCQATLTEALDQGITYVDTAPNYGMSQSYIGPVIAARRSGIFLTSKVEAQDRDGVLRQIDKSLADLRTDAIDLVHIHNLGDFRLETIDSDDGALTALRQAKDKGLIRHIGASGHLRPPHFPKLLERASDIDVVMCPINFVDRYLYPFESLVVPAVKVAGAALVGMKPLGGVVSWSYGPGLGRLRDEPHYTNTLRYAMGFPGLVTSVMGLCSPEEVRRAVAAARSFKPLSDAEIAALEPTGRAFAAEWGLRYGPPE